MIFLLLIFFVFASNKINISLFLFLLLNIDIFYSYTSLQFSKFLIYVKLKRILLRIKYSYKTHTQVLNFCIFIPWLFIRELQDYSLIIST